MSRMPESQLKDGFYLVRDCSICGGLIGYKVVEGRPYFDPHCDCMSYRIENPRPVTYAEFQEHLVNFHLCPQCLEYDIQTYISNEHEKCGSCVNSDTLDMLADHSIKEMLEPKEEEEEEEGKTTGSNAVT